MKAKKNFACFLVLFIANMKYEKLLSTGLGGSGL